MEIYQLKAFLAVARVGHLTRAADQLHITQPAVSKQIKALEEELGVLLFDRLPTGMVLTQAGQTLLPHAERTLFDAMELLNTAKRLQGEVAGVIRLGTIIDPESIKLGSFLGAVLQFYPLVQVKLLHGVSGSVMQQLIAGDLDAGFYLGEVNMPDVGHVLLKTVSYHVVAPPQWKERMAHASWKDIGSLPWVGTPEQSSQHRLVRSMLRQHGFEPRFVVEADQEASMISLVTSGVGLCLMRDELAQAAAQRGEVIVWDGVRQDCPLTFIYPKSREQDPALVGLRQVLKDIWV
jgi:DNA-binding transcriptional LysR family regulator